MFLARKIRWVGDQSCAQYDIGVTDYHSLVALSGVRYRCR